MLMKYSIIICSYNGENYIDTCLNSVFLQDYSNYEILVIDDGSTDQTKKILKKYHDTRLRVFSKENTGLSDSRNFGVQNAYGDYLLFLDVDDTLEPSTLSVLNDLASTYPDLIKIGLNYVYEEGRKVPLQTNYSTNLLSGEEAFQILVSTKTLFEMAQLYAYKKSFWEENQFSFTKGRYHEDFGLVPYIILKSKTVKLCNQNLYNYFQTEESITRTPDYEKIVKRAKDVFDYYLELKDKVKKEMELKESSKQIYFSFMANAILLQYKNLKGKEKKEYKEQIKRDRVLEDLLDDTIMRKLKKLWIKIKM